MAFWRTLLGMGMPDDGADTPNTTVGLPARPGDPDGAEFAVERSIFAPLPFLSPSAWDGYPEEWGAPSWVSGPTNITMQKLVDVAWAAIDLNSRVLSSFPVYRQRNGRIMSSLPYMFNPDPTIYSSWAEFTKQLFWDYQLGEAFVLPMVTGADTYPLNFRVIPPWLMNVELRNRVNPTTGLEESRRIVHFGSMDVTDEVLHIRNISNTAHPRGYSPLEAAGGKMVTIALLERFVKQIAETGGIPNHWLDVPGRKLDKAEAFDLLDQWVESRRRHAGGPGVLSGGVTLKQATPTSARDLLLLELSQFTESRISVLCGVPPFLIGLPMAQGESITYSNAATLFDFHERSGLSPMSNAVMQALSGWLLPRGQSIEQNRDAYSRPDYYTRAQANAIYLDRGVLSIPEVRASERFEGDLASASLTGAETVGNGNVVPMAPRRAPTTTPAPEAGAGRITGGSNGN